ncbi:hypothetical protein R3W88_028991 [Solanum pinnatisectum]|uniref:Cytochrome P450 n=1 Tax=Solanum pinnatisectum TaxID=50273 RepID=A0AAV9K4G2_9SOLN|nr:hypothetical protein R3W88_028991 [Solanum pinnatisectum]
MIFFLLFVAIPICLIFLLPKAKRGGKNKVPPGPLGFPFIGNLHQFDCLAPHIYFWKLSKKYGKVFSLKLASVPIVVVSSAKLAKEVLKTQDLVFCSKPSLVGQQKLSYNGHDIAFTPYNDYWREMRKVCVLHLFSLKKVHLFGPIRKDEVSRMIKKIYQKAANSQVTNLSNLLISLNSTIICRVAFGVRFDEEAYERKRFNHIVDEAEAMLASFFVSDFFPSLNWIDKLTGLTDRLEKSFKDLDEFYEELIEQHHNPNRPKSMEGDIIDLLLQLKKEQLPPIDLSLEDIKGILMNVLLGGSDTSAAMVIWSMTILIKIPKAMKKVQEEIRNLIEGYELQPRTIVYVNAWAIARDPEICENPEEFIPERFLNSDIDFKGQDYEFIPFGAGRRGCPAMALGVAYVELALSNLLYAFDWELPYGLKKEDIDINGRLGITVNKKNDLCLIPKKYF